MYYQETAIPNAYFITFTCYGTWLRGDKITSVDRHNNTPGTEFLSFNPVFQTNAKKLMTETAYILDRAQRQIVLNTIIEVCNYNRWVLLAAHVRTNHIHTVISAAIAPEKILNSIKAYASRRLNESKLDGNRINRWTRHGSTRYLWKDADIEATIQYVVYEQGSPMAVFENKERSYAIMTG